MSAHRTEPLSPEDRAFLEAELRAANQRPWQTWGVPTLAALFAAAVLTIASLFTAGLLASLLGFPIANGAWRDDPVTSYGAVLIGGGVFLSLAASYVRWLIRSRRSQAAYRQSIVKDIGLGMVKVEDHTVAGVKLLQEPEHQGVIFLLRLSNGKTLVLYDYDSVHADTGFPPAAGPTLVPRERISLRTFPRSQRRRWAFSGVPLPLPEPIELVLEPSKWPDDETWCRVKWENIERHYGPGAGGQATASRRS